ncbi:MAG: hypothetical protein QM761_06465 [Pseudoxanthomonas sp.]
MRKRIESICFVLTAAMFATEAAAQTPVPEDGRPSVEKPMPEAWFEIFRLAPGKAEQFVREIAKADKMSEAGGQPPIQLYFHEEGDDWDVLMLKPVPNTPPTPEQNEAMAAKAEELGIPSGPAYFFYIREMVAWHRDTRTTGPVTAAQWLEKADRWRAKNAAKQKHAGRP